MTPYNPILKTIHQCLILFKIDGILISMFSKTPIGKFLTPSHTLFPKDDNIIVTRGNVRFQLNRSDYMQWYIYAHLKDDVWKDALVGIEKKEKTHILDIGSNVGAFSFQLASKLKNHSKIHAFDPNPYIHRLFSQNLALNPTCASHIIFNPLAVGDAHREVEFSFEDINSGGGGIGKESSHSLSVQMTTVDQYVSDHQISDVHFMKIDVEGFEPFVIDGAKKTIEKYKPAIHIEITESWHQKNNTSSQSIFSFLESLGYSFYLETEEGYRHVASPFSLAQSNHQLNFLAKHG